ncbi:MAG TPA: hypothetical protein VF952_03850 [Chloroflexia bacterium]|jgi:hypothetical protein
MPQWDYSGIPDQQWQGTYARRGYLSLTRHGVQRYTEDDNPNYVDVSSSEPQSVQDFTGNGPAPQLLLGSEDLLDDIVSDVRD